MAYSGINQGVRGSDSSNPANNVPDIERVIQVLKPYQTPVLQWLWFSKRKAKAVTDPYGKFVWLENELFPHQTAVINNITATGTPASLVLTPLNVESIGIFNVDDIVFIENTDEPGYVVSKSNSQVVLNHLDGVSNLTGVSAPGAYIKIIGSRNSEYNLSRTPVTTREIEKFNYLTIFNESIATTGRQQAGKYFTDGSTHDELVEKRIEEMKLQIERYLLFAPVQGYATNGNIRTTWGHGFLGRIQTNVANYSVQLTEDDFDSYLRDIFAKGSNRKLHVCGSSHLTELNKFLKTRYELSPNPAINIYGVNLKEYITPFGIVDILWNPVMDGKFTDYGFTIDTEKVVLRYMSDDDKGSRKFRIEENVETPGIDGSTTKILFDLGIEIHNEECHGIIKKV